MTYLGMKYDWTDNNIFDCCSSCFETVWSTTVDRNSLPENIRTLQSFAQFRKAENKYYNSSNELPHGNLVNQ